MVDLRGFKGIQPTKMVDFSRGWGFQELSEDFWRFHGNIEVAMRQEPIHWRYLPCGAPKIAKLVLVPYFPCLQVIYLTLPSGKIT